MLKKFLQRFLSRRQKPAQRLDGFTLLELLIAMVISALVISSLLSFLVGLLESDRKEQAKANTQNEIQSAIEYIADDLQEAVYIYDADGLNTDTSTATPPVAPSGIKNQLPYDGVNTKTPVLAFWKRNYLQVGNTVTLADGTANRPVECIGHTKVTATASCFGTDRFVYSLVVYYLIDDNATPWSKAARIGRWEIKDGIKDPNCGTNATCTSAAGTGSAVRTDYTADTNFYYVLPDQGFRLFDTSKTGVLRDTMNLWKNTTGTSSAYNLNSNQISVLVDYIDDTIYSSNQDNGSGTGLVQVAIRPNTTVNTAGNTENVDCADSAKGGTGSSSQRVPSDFSSTTYNPLGKTSFYACINSFTQNPVARVYLRGNALAKLKDNPQDRCLQNDTISPGCTATSPHIPNSDTFLPTADVRIYGRSLFSPPK